MEPRIEILAEKMFIGIHINTSFANDRTPELWRNFMPRRNEIQNASSSDLVSLQIYRPTIDFTRLNPNEPFKKWALKEVSDFNDVPEGMETFLLSGGLYAVFMHRGPASEAEKTFGYIFGEWFPQSGYELDDRPHFEILGPKYKNNDPDSEEEVWVPVRMKI
jgi:AraC family transcriptional regulator